MQIKLKIEASSLPFSNIICDVFLSYANYVMPAPLPQSLMKLGENYDHHILATVGEYGSGELERTQQRLSNFIAQQPMDGIQKMHIRTAPGCSVSRCPL